MDVDHVVRNDHCIWFGAAVHQCDFVNPTIVADASPREGSGLVLVEHSFDVVVFNFLLSYLPAPSLRFRYNQRQQCSEWVHTNSNTLFVAVTDVVSTLGAA